MTNGSPALTRPEAYRIVMVLYAVIGAGLLFCFAGLSAQVEARQVHFGVRCSARGVQISRRARGGGGVGAYPGTWCYILKRAEGAGGLRADWLPSCLGRSRQGRASG
jgi:hypothetical protein